MQLFLTYITGRKCHPKLMPPLSPDLQVTFAQLIPALQGWRASTDSFSQHSQLRKYIAECDTLITNEDIRNEGARIIQEAEKGTQLSIMQFTLARDYLLCNLALATATRPSALNNVLVSDYETSRVSEANRIILVPEHKKKKSGPCHAGNEPSNAGPDDHTLLQGKTYSTRYTDKDKKKKYNIYLPGYNINKIHVNIYIFCPLTNSLLPSPPNDGTVVQRITQSPQIKSILSSMLLSNNYRT